MSFRKFLKDTSTPGAVFCFGRFNPAHRLHASLWKFVYDYGRKNKMDSIIFTSMSTNQKKNPLAPGEKIAYIQKFCNKISPKLQVSNDQSLKNTQQIVKSLIEKGYQRITFVVGGDRTNDFQPFIKQVQKFAEDAGASVEFKLETFSARVAGYSGTQMREYVKEGGFKSFKASLPKGLTEKESKEMFNKVREGLGL